MRLLCAILLCLLPVASLAASRPPAPPADEQAGPDHPGWSVDARSGCWVWNQFPRPNETVSWSGGCEPTGPATGSGILEWHQSPGWERYEATLRFGKLSGQGKFTSSNGNRYEGEWRDGLKNGQGVYVQGDGGRYEGAWKDGRYDGYGIATYATGDRYEGEWHAGRREGTGTMTFAGGNRYSGKWRDSRPEGLGEAWIDGKHYVGNWVSGCYRSASIAAAVGRPLSDCQ
jgi:hypothetical protein